MSEQASSGDVTLSAAPFVPKNPLEEGLVELGSGAIETADFLRMLLQEPLFILLDREPEGATLGGCIPMVVATAKDGPQLLAVFSDPERGGPMIDHFPDYKWVAQVTFAWIIEHAGDSCGVILNAGSGLGIEIAPAGLKEIRESSSS